MNTSKTLEPNLNSLSFLVAASGPPWIEAVPHDAPNLAAGPPLVDETEMGAP